MKQRLVELHNKIDGLLKFPGLKSGEIGIQVGFDMSSPNLTTDLLVMGGRAGKQGTVVGIDPDPFNHEAVKPVLEELNLDVRLVQKATYRERTTSKLVIAKRTSWNKLEVIDSDKPENFTSTRIEVELDTLDHIVEELNLPVERISHINITNNGAEYDTLLGMAGLLDRVENLALTVIAGRPGKMGTIDGRPDHEVIMEHLEGLGFETKFYRMSQLAWWGVFHKLLFKRKWVFGRKPYGVVMAGKGTKKIRFYQSYS